MRQYEYEHFYLKASVAEELDDGTQGWEVKYDLDYIRDELNKAGAEGWKVISMEPLYAYNRREQGQIVSSIPLGISAWFVTAVRPLTHLHQDESAPQTQSGT